MPILPRSLFGDYSPTPETRPARTKGTPERSRALFSGLDCLPDQIDLFDVDGHEQAAQTTTEREDVDGVIVEVTRPTYPRPRLTYLDISELCELETSVVAEIAGETLNILCSIPAIHTLRRPPDPATDGRDAAGFAIRGASVYDEELANRPRRELAACHVLLTRWTAYQPIIDAVDRAHPND